MSNTNNMNSDLVSIYPTEVEIHDTKHSSVQFQFSLIDSKTQGSQRYLPAVCENTSLGSRHMDR